MTKKWWDNDIWRNRTYKQLKPKPTVTRQEHDKAIKDSNPRRHLYKTFSGECPTCGSNYVRKSGATAKCDECDHKWKVKGD
jgi:predicted RNA-binding Zn-ribbon protein involved in translation (DUF1610 family)